MFKGLGFGAEGFESMVRVHRFGISGFRASGFDSPTYHRLYWEPA